MQLLVVLLVAPACPVSMFRRQNRSVLDLAHGRVDFMTSAESALSITLHFSQSSKSELASRSERDQVANKVGMLLHMTSKFLQLRCAMALVAGLVASASPARAERDDESRAPVSAQQSGGGETVREAMCRLIETSARNENLPVEFFTRLIFRESSFRPHVVSPAGAQGIAQFMPGTAAERGLLDPFDPEQAIPASARLLRDLRTRFGNLGLAAAAYNGGPGRVSAWQASRGGLPAETRDYVLAITGSPAEDWAEGARSDADLTAEKPPSCLTVVARLGRPGSGPMIASAPFAPWGVQLAGNFSRSLALASYQRAQRSLATLIADRQPMIIGTRLRHRGTRAFYRVRVPAQTRAAADTLCTQIRGKGGSCIVLKS